MSGHNQMAAGVPDLELSKACVSTSGPAKAKRMEKVLVARSAGLSGEKKKKLRKR